MKKIQGKPILVLVGARFQLTGVQVVGNRLYILKPCRESTEKEAKVLKKLYARGKIIKQSFENMKNYEELGGFYPPWQKDNTEYPLSV